MHAPNPPGNSASHNDISQHLRVWSGQLGPHVTVSQFLAGFASEVKAWCVTQGHHYSLCGPDEIHTLASMPRDDPSAEFLDGE
eukprot:7090812-Alexandrium_andersonii.AAC.1